MQTYVAILDTTGYPKWLQGLTGVTHSLETLVFLVKQKEVRNSICSIQVGLDICFST